MKITSVASAIPITAVSNDEVEARLNLEPGWIERRTGIRQRPTAPAADATSDLAIRAATRALEQTGADPKDIGLLLLATSTPDHLLPPTAPLVAHRLGLTAGAIDLAGACSGFLYALVLASSWADSVQRPALVIGANVLTRRVNARDPATVALFSDGAGAVVVSPSEPSCLLGSYLGSDGSAYDTIGIQAGGSRETLSSEGLQQGRNLMTIRRGAALFREAVHAMVTAGRAAMQNANMATSAIDLWIPHQANARIIQDSGRLLNIPSERTINVVAQYGNSSAASIPVALAHAVDSGQALRGNVLLLTAAGAGLINAGVVLRW